MKADLNDLKKLTMELMKNGTSKDIQKDNEGLIEKIYGNEDDNTSYEEAQASQLEVFIYSRKKHHQKLPKKINTILLKKLKRKKPYLLHDKELELIKKSLERHKGKRKLAAEELGISERTLYRKIKTIRFIIVKHNMKYLKYLFITIFSLSLFGCGIYSLTGADVGDAKTFQVNYFQNNALLVEPGLDRDFTQALQDLIQNQTNLSLVNSGGDLVYEGEITEYRISPTNATANSTAAQNRLSVTVNVNFTNKKKEDADFSKKILFLL